MNLDKNYKGIDADLETSLEEYGFVARPITVDYPDEYFVIYKMGENEYGSGHIRVSELDAIVNGTEWASDDDINSMLETVGSSKEEWMSLPFESKFNDLISYWGTENVMGTDYYPNDKKWAFEEIGIDESEEDDTFEINSISELYDWEESSQYPYARDMVAYFIFGDRDDNLIDKAIRGVYSKERADESKLSEIMLGYENNWKENMEQLDIDTVEELGDLMDYYAKGGSVKDNLEKELRKLQRELNGSRLGTYIEGDDSEEAMALRRERESKLTRFNEVLKTLNEIDKDSFANGGSIGLFEDGGETRRKFIIVDEDTNKVFDKEFYDWEDAWRFLREKVDDTDELSSYSVIDTQDAEKYYADGGGVETRTISYEDGGLAGLVDEEQMRDISFKIKVKTMPKEESIILHEVVEIEEYDAVGEKNVNLPKFHLIYGNNSLAIFDAFGVDEVAGLKREDAVEFIENLKKQGKTEKDGSFMAGLTNFSGDQIFMFFNVERLNFKGFANRVLPHEALHLSRYLISLYKNKWMRENLNTPNWWEDKRATFTELNDDNEEFFAETLERTTAIAMDGWFRATGSRCLADGGNIGLFEDGGETEESRLVGSFYYDTRKDKTFRIIYSDKNKIQIQYFNRNKEEEGKLIDVPKDEFNYLLQMGAWNKYKQSFFKDGGGVELNGKKVGVAKRLKIKNWYLKTYPTDDLGEEINNEITFWSLYGYLSQGINVYSVLGVSDSIVRERVFEKLSEILGVEYDYIYKLWLRSSDEYADGGDIGFFKSGGRVLKGSSVGVGKLVDNSRVVEEFRKGGGVDEKFDINYGDKLDLGGGIVKYFKQWDGEKIIVVDSTDDLQTSKGSYAYPSSIKRVIERYDEDNDLYAGGGGVDGDYYAKGGDIESSQDFFLSEKELKNYNHEKIGDIDFYYKKSNKNRYSGVTKEVYFKDSTRPSFSVTFESEPKKVYDKLKEWTKTHKYNFNDITAVKYADGGDIENEFYIFEGIDHYSSTPLFRVESTSDSDAEYIGEWHTDRDDAEMELRELNADSFNEDIYSNVDEELIRVSAEEIYNEQGFMNFRNLFLKLADTDERSGDIETANFRRALVKEYQEKQPRIK